MLWLGKFILIYYFRLLDATTLPEKFEIRLNELFKYKEKWTFKEMNYFFNDLNIVNLEEKLGKFCKVISENNPFDNKKPVISYYQKYKLY